MAEEINNSKKFSLSKLVKILAITIFILIIPLLTLFILVLVDIGGQILVITTIVLFGLLILISLILIIFDLIRILSKRKNRR